MREITYEDKILMLGSCFSENMFHRFEQAYFRAVVNPFGVLYNPLSIARSMEIMLYEKNISQLHKINHNGLWHSMIHHGDFSRADKKQFDEGIARSIESGRKALREASVVIVTWGTAWVYELEGEIVGNCHKIPQKCFTRRRLSVSEIVECWQKILDYEELQDKHFIFTISPIRHLKDGLHENQLSKATLMLAAEQLTADAGTIVSTSYFPSYELLIDELRDYRFYADDMLHPSSVAINYIWERFCETYFSSHTLTEMQALMQLYRNLHHRPMHTDTKEYEIFRNQTELKAAQLRKSYPWIAE